MKAGIGAIVCGIVLGLGAVSAQAEGQLNLYNWGDYTSPEMIKKFEEKYKVKVTVTDFDTNDTALSKVRAGGHGFDMVVASANYIPVWIKEGLLLESRPDQMDNFKNLDPKWVDVPFDPGHHYTVPWQWGTTAVLVNTDVYKGDINTSSIFLDPPPELKGKINVVPEMNDVMALVLMYLGGEPCSGDKELLKKALAKLLEAKKSWISMDYANPDRYAKGDLAAGVNWNGWSFRARLLNDKLKFGYPKEGFVIFMDSLGILKDAKNVENAKLFQNFMMEPESAGMLSGFARYANGITGSDAFMPADMKDAPEIKIPAELAGKGHFIPACTPEVNELYTKIWTEVQK